MRRLATLLLYPFVLLNIACEEPQQPPINVDANEEDLAECLQGEPFVATGQIPLPDAGPGDAERIADLRWEAHDGCERLVIDLEVEEGQPATSAGEVAAEVMRDLALVRVHLPNVRWVDFDAMDATFDGPLARSAYVIWPLDAEGTYIDVHLAEPAEAHVLTLDGPARVVVDLRPGGPAIPDPPASADHIVVLQPRSGEATYPIGVIGYGRTFEANVVVRLEHDGEEVFSDFTTATAWADAWGHFQLTVDDGPSGPVTLHVGEYSAKDGTWSGAEIELEMR